MSAATRVSTFESFVIPKLRTADKQSVRFTPHDEIISPQRYHDNHDDDDDDDKKSLARLEADFKDSIMETSTPITNLKDIPTAPTSAQYLLTSRLALRKAMESWEPRSRRPLPDAPQGINGRYILNTKPPVLDTTIFSHRLSPRLSHARKLALGMRVPSDTLASSITKHIFELKPLGPMIRNKMVLYRQARREIRRTAKKILPALREKDDCEAEDEETHVSSSSSSSSLTVAAAVHPNADDNISSKVAVMHNGFYIGRLPSKDVKKHKHWTRSLTSGRPEKGGQSQGRRERQSSRRGSAGLASGWVASSEPRRRGCYGRTARVLGVDVVTGDAMHGRVEIGIPKAMGYLLVSEVEKSTWSLSSQVNVSRLAYVRSRIVHLVGFDNLGATA